MSSRKTSIFGIVVAVVCVFAAVGIALFGYSWHRGRQEAERRRKAAKRLKQIGDALLQYSGDNSGFLQESLDSDVYSPPGVATPKAEDAGEDGSE